MKTVISAGLLIVGMVLLAIVGFIISFLISLVLMPLVFVAILTKITLTLWAGLFTYFG